MINKILGLITILFSIIFFSYKKGKKDTESEQVKEMFDEVKRINNLKNEQERLSGDDLNAYYDKLHNKD